MSLAVTIDVPLYESDQPSCRTKEAHLLPNTQLRLALGQNEISTLIASAARVSSSCTQTTNPVWFVTASMTTVALKAPAVAWERAVFPIPHNNLTRLQSAGTAIATQRQRQGHNTTDPLLPVFESRRHSNCQSQRHLLQPTCRNAVRMHLVGWVLEQERGNGQTEQICCRWS